MAIPDKLKIVAVHWVDSEGSAYEWIHSDDLDYSGELPLCFSTGILLHEDDLKVVLAQNIAHLNHTDLKQIGHVITIPKVAITNNGLRVLTEFNVENLKVKGKQSRKLWKDCSKRKAKVEYICVLCNESIEVGELHYARSKKRAHLTCGDQSDTNPKNIEDNIKI